MSQRQVIARSQRRRVRAAAAIAQAPLAPVIQHGGRNALLSGTAFAALVSCGLFSFNGPAWAQLPTGGTVVGGQATITQNSGSQLTVNQTTDRGVIDWRSFSIGQGNRVDFIQPGRTSVTLNRVTGADPSVIAGSLTATGQLVLINQAGVMFAGGAQVNVESLIASTANVANPQAFMAGGKIAFDQAGSNPNARVVNDGSITVRDGGLVALLGPSAANNGVINAKLGRVTVGGAETFTVDLNGDGLVNFAVGNPVSKTPRDKDGKALPLASNTGTINADGGQVAITAAAAREVVNGVVNVEGRINARTVQNEGGVIVFGGGETTQVNVAGAIDVSGAGAGQKGGTVHITASKVNVRSTAKINANGDGGGGTVLVGGGYQGKGPIANAKTTTVARGATITADATGKGNGGTVVVWADNTTVFAGTISANGGAQGGDGGLVETSGKDTLKIRHGASVQASALGDGKNGLWLIDPTNLNLNGAALVPIVAALAAGTDVTTQTAAGGGQDGNITLSANATAVVAVDKDVTWTLQAHGKISLGAKNIVLTAFAGRSANLVLDTQTLAGAAVDHSITGTGAITATSVTAKSAIAGGSVSLTGKIVATNVNFVSNGAVTINNAGNDISNFASVASTAGGAVTLLSTEVVTIGDINAGANTINISTTGAGDNITLSGTLTGSTVTVESGGSLGGTGAITSAGAVALKADNGGTINLSGTIAGTELTVQSPGAVTLSGADNVFNTFNSTGAIGGDVSVVHKGDLTIKALDVGAKAASFTTNTAGKITLAGTLDSTGGVTLNAAGALSIEAKINGGGGNVALSGTSISQTNAGIITAAGLLVNSAGTVDLTSATNVIATLAGSADNLGLLESNGFSIGTVNGVDGLTITTALQLEAGGTINQSQLINAPTVGITTTAGDIDLTGASNKIGTFAASSAGSIGLLETNALVIGSSTTVGALAAIDGINANGVSIKAGGTVSQTKSITAGANGLAVVTTAGDIELGTNENATTNVAFNSAGSASYQTSTDLKITSVAAIGGLDEVSGATIVGTLTLKTTGAATTITQDKAISVATLDVTTGGGGTVTLTDAGNLIGTVQSSTSLGTGSHQIVDSDGGMDVAAITSTGNLALTTAGGGLTLTGAVNVGAKTLALTANGDNTITATAAAITAGTLTLETGAGGKATIQLTTHDIANVQTAGAGVGTGGLSFKQERAAGTTVGPITSAGNVSINDGVGDVTVAGDINVTNKNVTLAASAGKLNINAKIGAGSGQVALLAQGDVTQANANAGITADSLRGESTGGNVVLAPTGVTAADVNTVNTFAGEALAGSVSFRNSGTFTVGKVNNTSGINATASVTLQVNDAGGTINQTAGADGAIVTPTLNLTTNNGNVTINSVNNDIAALGTVNLGTGALTFSTARAAGFNLGAITANGGIDVTNTTGDLTTTGAVTSDGTISLRSTTGLLTLNGAVTSNNGGITLRSGGALNTGAFLIKAATPVTGDVTLISDTSTVTIGGGGVTVGDTLTIQIGAGLTLNVAGAITATSVALHADIIEISAAINATDTITLAPVTAGTAVTVGGVAAAGFVIDNTELTFLTTANTLTIGKQSTGTVTSGAISVDTADVANGTLNLFSTSTVTQVAGTLTVGGGSGALNVNAGGDVTLLSSLIGSIGGGTTSGKFSVLRSSAGAQALTVNAVTTNGGDIAIRNFDGNVVVAGAVSSGGGDINIGANDTAGSTITLNAPINAGAGMFYMFSSGGVTQNAGGIITAGSLASENFQSGNLSFNADNVVSGNIAFDNPFGNVAFRNTVDFNVGGVPTAFTIANLNFSIAVSGIQTSATGSTTLTTGGNITQGAAALDAISTETLIVSKLGAANPTVTLDNTSNAITNLGAVTLGTGAFTLVDAGGLTITGAATAGSYTVTTDGGSLVQNAGAAINTSASNGDISLVALNGAFPGAAITLNDNLNAGGGTVSLSATGSVSQVAGAITAASVDAVSTGVFTSVSLNSATNAFGKISGSSNGIGGFSATTTQTLTVENVTVTNGGVSLTSTGAASDLSVNGLISAGGLNVTLTAGKDITQTATGGITAAGLQLLATSGTVDLSTGAANNTVTTIAGKSNGDFTYKQAGSLIVGTVTTVGVTSGTGNVTIDSTAGDLTVSSAVSGKNTVALTAKNALAINAGVTSTAGNVDLESTAGTLTTTALVQANGNAELTSASDLSIGGGVTATTGTITAKATTGALTTTSALQANGDIQLASDKDLSIGGTVTSTAGNVAAKSTVGALSTTALVQASGNVELTSVGLLSIGGGVTATNGTVTATSSAGKLTTSAAVQSNGDVQLTSADDMSIGGTVTSTAGNVTAKSTTGGLSTTATVQANGNVELTSSGLLSIGAGVTATNGTVTATSSAGKLTTSAAVQSNGDVQLTSADDMSIGGTVTSTNGKVTAASTAGGLTVSKAISGKNDVALTAKNAVQINATVTSTAGNVDVESTAGTLSTTALVQADGNVELTSVGDLSLGGGATATNGTVTATSSTGKLSTGAAVQAKGDIQFTSVAALSIDGTATSSNGNVTAKSTAGTLSTTAAVQANGNVELTSVGDLSIGANATATTGTVTATSSAGRLTTTAAVQAKGDIGLTSSGILSIGGTVTSTAGNVTAKSTTGALATTAAVQANGNVQLTSVDTLSIGGDVTATNGTVTAESTGGLLTTSAKVLANGDIQLTSVGDLTIGALTKSTTGNVTATTTGALITNGDVTADAAGRSVTLKSAGDLTVNSTITANAADGLVSLTSTTGSVVEQTSGVITAAQLLAQAAVNVDIAQSSNLVGATGFAATATTGFVVFINTGAITLDTVNGVNGVTAGGAVVLATTAGDITQTANGIITAGAGLGLAAPGGSILLNQANKITGDVAVVNTASGNVTIRTVGDLKIGTVGPITTAGTFVPELSGILASTAAGKFVALISDTGAISQSTATEAKHAIIGNELRVTTNGKDATLNNKANKIAEVGNSNLGAGQLTVLDSFEGLSVTNPITADGGVILTTQTVFSLPGSITVANGDISLTSLTGSITLSSTLSAVNGQIQLDAGGAGTIAQTGGTITSKTLIARAPGDISITEANNDVGTIAGKSTSGAFTYVDKTAVTIGSLVDSTAVAVSGVTTTNKDITIVAGSGITVDQAINAGTGIARLETATGDITQAATGLITAAALLANATAGSVNLTAVANAVAAVAGKTGGSFRLLTSGDLDVTTVAADGGALTTAATGVTSGGDMAIQTAGDLTLLQGLDAGANTIRLRTTAGGGVSQAAVASIVADALLIDAAGSVALTTSVNNDVNTLAGRSTGGTFRFQDKNGFTVGTVSADGAGLGPVLAIGPLTGITTANADITLAAAGGQLTLNEAVNAGLGGGTIRLLTGAGDLTQGVNGTLTGGSLLAISTGGTVNLTGAKNNVTGIAGAAFKSFLFRSEIGITVTNTAFASDGVVPSATGITANSGGGATPFVVDLAVASGALTINGPVSSANGMIVYRRAPGGVAGAINVGGGAGNPGNDVSTSKLVVIDLTGADPASLYGATPGTALGGLFTTPTPRTGTSPLPAAGNVGGGIGNIGELNAVNSTVYIFANGATVESSSGGATFGLLGVYGNNNSIQLTTTVRSVDPNSVRAIGAPFVEPLVGGSIAAFYVRRSGLPVATEQFNACPIGTINCTVFTPPIAAPSTSTDDVVIGVAGAPLDDSGIVLVNQGNEDLITDDDEEEKKRKRKGRTE